MMNFNFAVRCAGPSKRQEAARAMKAKIHGVLIALAFAGPSVAQESDSTAATSADGLALAASPTSVGVIASQTAPVALGDTKSAYRIAERGPHHRVWQRVTAETNPLGRVHYRTNSYTELATGMH